MRRFNFMVILFGLLLFAGTALGQEREKSPKGKAATQIGNDWIEVTYSRPILRGRRAVFGENQDDQSVYAGAPVWRFGANTSTRLHTEVALDMGGTTVPAGEYSLFVEIGSDGWTLIVSSHAAQKKYKEGDGIWGSYGYDSAKDVARVPMQVSRLDGSVDQMTIGFMNVTEKGGTLAMWWDDTMAAAPFTVAGM